MTEETVELQDVKQPLLTTGEDQSPVQASTSVEPPATEKEAAVTEVKTVNTLPNEYRFIQQRIPPKNSNLKYTLPCLLLGFQIVFIILFAFFGKYNNETDSKEDKNKYTSKKMMMIRIIYFILIFILFILYQVYQDLHIITLLGFGFLMAFLKRYGYGSIGFNLLLVAFVIQWSLLIRGWIELNINCNGEFQIDLNK